MPLGRSSDAFKFYDRAYQINPNNYFLVNNFATLLVTINEYDRAIEVMDKFLIFEPDNSDALIVKSKILSSRSEMDSYESQKVKLQGSITEAVLVSDWDKVVSLCVNFGEPKEGAPWWYFAVGMAMIFK